MQPSLAPRPTDPIVLSDRRMLASGPPQLLGGLSERERAHVIGSGQRKLLSKGQTLFRQGTANDGIYIIERGRIRVFYVAPSGREITRAYWSTGDFVGGPDVFGRAPHVWSGVATNNCCVLHVPARALQGLVSQVPAFAIGLVDGLAFKGRTYAALTQMLGTRSVTERLASLLLHLAENHGRHDSGGIVVDSGFSQADLAHLVGATRQWVAASLKRLQDQDILEMRRSAFVIYRSDLLGKLKNGI